MSMKTAIVTTYRGAATILDSFLTYHLALGFDHIFLFSDDPQDPGTEIARRYPNVTVVGNDDQLKARWRKTPLYRTRKKWVETYLNREVMARQMLNVEVAIEMARDSGVDWLLHVDVDELFYCPDTTIAEHFQDLAEQGIVGVRYLNYEAVPERADVVDSFREVSLFKVNQDSLPGGTLTQEQEELVKSIPHLHGHYFHYYRVGKSAARVIPGLMPAGVHRFAPRVRLQGLYEVQQWLAIQTPVLWLRQRGLVPGLRKALLREGLFKAARRSNPAILHYPCCTFDVFWGKYRARGAFADKWFGKFDIRKALGTTHLESRDVVAKGDPELARRFYEDRFVASEEDARRLVESGLAVRIHAPAELLERVRPASSAPADMGMLRTG